MARITVEDCLENVDNRFELVMKATKRARQLATGGKDPMVKEDSDKATVIALREIAEGLVTEAVLQDTFEEETESEEGEIDRASLEQEIQQAGIIEQVAESDDQENSSASDDAEEDA